jgi:hypothetical protein
MKRPVLSSGPARPRWIAQRTPPSSDRAEPLHGNSLLRLLHTAGNQAVWGVLRASAPLVAGPQAVQVLLAARHDLGNQTIQRKIRVQDGRVYAAADEGTNQRFRRIVQSPATYLARSGQDLHQMKTGNDAPLLAPRKHLIGECHSASQFTTAVHDWAWGAEMLTEAYSSHRRLIDSAKEEKQSAPTGNADEQVLWRQAGALEDRGAAALADLVNARIVATRLLQTTNALHGSGILPEQTPRFTGACELGWKKCKLALIVALELTRYISDSSKARGWGIFGSYFPDHQLVAGVVNEQLLAELGGGLDNIMAQLDDMSRLHLEPAKLLRILVHIDALIPVLRSLVASHDPHGHTETELKTATDSAIAHRDIGRLSPVRERYMRQRIESAGVPTLVRIGQGHVANLRKNGLPQQTLAFDDYQAFRLKNSFLQVDVD